MRDKDHDAWQLLMEMLRRWCPTAPLTITSHELLQSVVCISDVVRLSFPRKPNHSKKQELQGRLECFGKHYGYKTSIMDFISNSAQISPIFCEVSRYLWRVIKFPKLKIDLTSSFFDKDAETNSTFFCWNCSRSKAIKKDQIFFTQFFLSKAQQSYRPTTV